MKLLARPLAFACVFFVASSVMGYFVCGFGELLCILSSVIACVLLVLNFIFKKRADRLVFTLFLCALFSFLAFLTSHLYFGVKLAEVEKYYGREVIIEGSVRESVYSRSYGGLYYIETETVDGEKLKANLILETDSAALSDYDTFVMSVALEPFSENISGYAERAISMSEGFLCSCVQSGDEFSITGKREKNIISYIYDARKWTAERFDALLDTRAAGLFTAAFTGDDSYVSDYDMLALLRSGTTHILAVSGTHFTVIMAAVLFFLKPLGFPLWLRNTSLCIIALIYTAFTGFSPSVVRSAVMLLFTYLGSTLGRSRDMFTSLCLTMTVMIVFSPYLVLNAAFWLSSVATLGIILCLPVLEEMLGHKHKTVLSDILRDEDTPLLRRVCRFLSAVAIRWIKSIPAYLFVTVTVSLFAAAVAIPVSLIFFKNMSLAAIISGFIMSPIASAVIVAAPFVLILGSIPFVSYLCYAASELFYGTAHFFSNIDGVYINIDYTAVKIAIAVFFLTVIVVVLFSKTQKPLIAVFAVFFIFAVGTARISEAVIYGGFDFAYNSERDADTVSVRGESGTVIADMGSTTRSDIKAGIAAAADFRQNTVSAYVITDMKAKHVSLVRYLCSNYRVKVLYLPQYASEDKQALTNSAEREVQEFGVEVRYFNYGEEFSADGACVYVSELEFISRSTIPLYSVSVGNSNGSATWVSGSYFEREHTESLYRDSSDILVFGAYGARIKSECEADISRLLAQSFVVSSEQILSSFSVESLEKMNERGLTCSDSVYFHSKKRP